MFALLIASIKVLISLLSIRMSALIARFASRECPAHAIYSEDEVPAGMEQFIQLNAELAKSWPTLSEVKDALPDADEWNGKSDKADLLER